MKSGDHTSFTDSQTDPPIPLISFPSKACPFRQRRRLEDSPLRPSLEAACTAAFVADLLRLLEDAPDKTPALDNAQVDPFAGQALCNSLRSAAVGRGRD